MIDRAFHWFMWRVERYLDMPYRWGGDDPAAGFDCSGMVVEALKCIGAIEIHRDFSADGLWHKYHGRLEIDKPRAGALAFWFNNSGRATHVAVCLDSEICMTADGGGSKIVDLKDAIDHNAFVKLRPISHRRQNPRFVYIFDG